MDWTREEIAQRAVKELKDGSYVNVGIGIPTLVANYVPPEVKVVLQGENGMLGLGPYPVASDVDPDLTNASKQTITPIANTSYFSSAESFAMMRGGHIDVTMLGAMQVSEKGDIANWAVPGKVIKGMGGAMDLVSGARKVIVLMEHNSNDGAPKLVKDCTLPLTGKGVVRMVITSVGVFECDPHDGLTLVDKAPGVTLDEIKARTGANFKVALESKCLAA